MISTIKLIAGLLSAIPILDRWFRLVQLAYIEVKIQQNDVRFRDDMEAAVKQFDAKRLAADLGSLLDE